MDHIWSPWRMKYIEQHRKPQGCVFCRALEEEDGTGNLIVFRNQRAFAILNRFPYTTGHLLIVPYLHAPSLEDLDAPTRAEMMEMATHAMRVLRKIYTPHAFNLGANIGEAAGAGIADHVHIHVVPRWLGDNNFMSSLGQTRVLPEELGDTYRRMIDNWALKD